MEVEEQDNAEAEARGEGTYSLHAVLGQGSFGRIHLASWRRKCDAASGFGLTEESSGSTNDANSCEARPGQFGANYPSKCAAGQAAVAAAAARAAYAVCPVAPAGGGYGLLPGTQQCERCILLEEEGVGGGDRKVLEAGAPRLRALKSVCKRKVTEKGLVRHMETVSERCLCCIWGRRNVSPRAGRGGGGSILALHFLCRAFALYTTAVPDRAAFSAFTALSRCRPSPFFVLHMPY